MSDTDIVDSEARPRDFAAFLMDHCKGLSHEELSTALRDVVLAVAETGKAGHITYTLVIRPQERVDGAVVVADNIKTKIPTFDRPCSVFFATRDGDLVRNDPRQTSIFDLSETRQ